MINNKSNSGVSANACIVAVGQTVALGHEDCDLDLGQQRGNSVFLCSFHL